LEKEEERWVRGSETHLASTLQGGSCCVFQKLIQLHGNFSVICQIKAAKRSLSRACLFFTRNMLKQLTYSHHTFGFKKPPLCMSSDRPTLQGKPENPMAGPCPSDIATGTGCAPHCPTASWSPTAP